MLPLLMTLACGGPGEKVSPGTFALEDVNTTSASYGEMVAPDDYVGRVSAWYFGHAT